MNPSKLTLVLILAIFTTTVLQTSAQKRSIISGVVTEKYETKEGNIIIKRPEKLFSGKTTSGTIVVEPKSENPVKRSKQIEKLLSYTLALGKTFPVQDGFFATDLPESEIIPLKLINNEGGLIEESMLEMKEFTPQKFNIPNTIKVNNIEKITGDFSGDITQANLTIDEKPAELIAGNQSELFYQVSDINPGRHTMNLDYGEVHEEKEISLVDYSLEAGRLDLNKGEHSYLKVKVEGLKDIQEPLTLNVVNESTNVINLEGGVEQSIVIVPEEVAETGVWEKRFDIQSIKTGAFTISTDLAVPDIEIQDNLEEKPEEEHDPMQVSNIEPVTSSKEIPLQRNEAMDVFQQKIESLQKEIDEDKPGFTDETLKPCDTTEVDFHIRTQINSISNSVCELDSSMLDSLFNLFDNYEKALWERDSLQGVLNTANEFKDRLIELKGSAVGEFQEQIDKLDAMTSNSENCAPGWEDEFYNRYVAPYSPNNQRQVMFQNYVRRYKRSFEHCIRHTKNNLERDQQEIERRYDKSYISVVNEIISKLENQLNEASSNAIVKEQKLKDMLASLLNQLCQIDIQWQALISFMDSNMVCIKCGDVYFTKPAELIEMESCLTDFVSKIFRKIAGIRQPLSTNTLQSLANGYFDLNEMDENLQKLDSLKNTFAQIINSANQSGNVNFVHPCCERLHELMSGVYLYDHQVKSYSEMSTAAKQYGFGNQGLIPVPANPSQYKNDEYKDQYRDERGRIYEETNRIQNEVERTLRKLKNGCNGGQNSSEYGLKDEKAMELHGAVNAAPLHQQSSETLKDLLLDFLQNMENCYNQAIQNQRHRSYTHIVHRCFTFRLCLELLDQEFDNYNGNCEDAERQLRNRLTGIQARAKKIQDEINALNTRISAINSRIDELRQNSTVNSNQNLQRELNELQSQKNLLVSDSRDLQSKLDDLNEKLDRISSRLDNMCGNMGIRAVGSIEDCEALRDQIIDAVNDNIEEVEELNNELDNNETTAGEAENTLEEAHNESGYVADDIESLENSVRSIEEEEENRMQLAHQQEEERKDCACEDFLNSQGIDKEQASLLRDLEQIKDEIQEIGGWVSEAAELGQNIPNQKIQELAGKLSEGIDAILSPLEKYDELKGQVEDLLEIKNLINNFMNTGGSASERAEKFGDYLSTINDIVGEIGDKFPILQFFTAYFDFLVQGYLEAVNGIQRILKNRFEIIIESALNRTHCETLINDYKKNNNLDDVYNSAYRICGENFYVKNKEQKSAFREVVREKTLKKLMDCCLERLGN